YLGSVGGRAGPGGSKGLYPRIPWVAKRQPSLLGGVSGGRREPRCWGFPAMEVGEIWQPLPTPGGYSDLPGTFAAERHFPRLGSGILGSGGRFVGSPRSAPIRHKISLSQAESVAHS